MCLCAGHERRHQKPSHRTDPPVPHASGIHGIDLVPQNPVGLGWPSGRSGRAASPAVWRCTAKLMCCSPLLQADMLEALSAVTQRQDALAEEVVLLRQQVHRAERMLQDSSGWR
mmetsp:Transcript_4987/g.13945  ORF Transcript_4987/g.13945 Transcript_4987/m.13945 type:complete len:114 (-) Transcript_4987:394-735(-)